MNQKNQTKASDKKLIQRIQLPNIDLRGVIPYLALILVLLFFSVVAANRFLTYGNLAIILQQTSVLAIVAFGMHFVIVSGSIDLSVGSVLALSGMIGAGMATQYGFAGLFIGVLAGALMGLINGMVFTWMKIPSFITTLGMLMVSRGLTILYSHSNPIPMPMNLSFIGEYPNILWVTIIIFVLAFILFSYTTFGRNVLAIGGNERVARLNGLPVNRGKIMVFLMSGTLAGIGGIVLASRLGAATPTAGVSFELSVISAVVLGGTPLTGGVGKIHNTVVGALITSILGNGLVILGVSSEIQQIITGIILILAVFISLDRDKIGIIK